MKTTAAVMFTLLGLVTSLSATTEHSVSGAERELVVASITRTIAEDYIDPNMAKTIGSMLAQQLADDAYETLDDPHEFAGQLTADLVKTSHDLHFNVSLDAQWVHAENEAENPEVVRQARAKELARARQQNHGFRELRILEGNIGYLNFTYFDDPEPAHDTVAAVMKFLSHTDAVIIDLRFNNGGYLEMAQLLCSYFLPSTPSQVLFDFYDLEEGRRIDRKQWVLPSVAGVRMPDTPLYLLIGSTTFSAAEWFAFILKNLGRATVIGERTAGGAHPVNRRALNDRFVLQVPTGEIRDGVSGKDFEGVGVVPDLSAVSVVALHQAHREALQALIELEPENRDAYAWYLPAIDARLHSPEVDPALLESLAGDYDGTRKITQDRGTLYYSWDARGRLRLKPLGHTLLALEGVDDFRFRIRAKNGVVTGIERIYMDGRTRLHPKTR